MNRREASAHVENRGPGFRGIASTDRDNVGAGRCESDGDHLTNALNFGARAVLTRDLTPGELTVLRKLEAKDGMPAAATALLNIDAALTR